MLCFQKINLKLHAKYRRNYLTKFMFLKKSTLLYNLAEMEFKKMRNLVGKKKVGVNYRDWPAK